MPVDGDIKLIIDSRVTIKGDNPKVFQLILDQLLIPNPDYIKKARYGFSTAGIPKSLALYSMRGDDIIVPYGALHYLLEVCPDAEIDMRLPDPATRQVKYGKAKVPLYDYQQKAVDAVVKSCCGILKAPAGSGKTQMGIAIAVKLGLKTLWLTHTADLCLQSYKRAAMYIDESKLGQITAGKCKIGTALTIATVQTLANMDLLQLKYEWDCIIVDECHRVAGSELRMTMFSKVLNNLGARYKYGLSATVERSDGLIACTFAMLGHIIYEVPESEVADRIMAVNVAPVDTYMKPSAEYENSDGTINYSKYLNYVAVNEERAKEIVKWMVRDKKHSILVLSDRVNHLYLMQSLLPDGMKEKSAVIEGESTKRGMEERSKVIQKMREKKLKYLFASYPLAKEGLDIPILSRVYMATPHSFSAVILQSIGRASRICKGKPEPLAIDFVDASIPLCMNLYLKRARLYRRKGIKLVDIGDDGHGEEDDSGEE